MAVDNAQTLNFYNLRASDIAINRKLISDSQCRSAFVAVVYENKLLANETDR